MSSGRFRDAIDAALGESPTPAGSSRLDHWLAPTGESRVEQVRVESIAEPDWRPAVDHADPAYRALKSSIRASGILQPLLLRPLADGGYQVVSGLRRLQAARQTGQVAVPAVVRELSDAEAVIGTFEALLRTPLSPAEHGRLRERLSGAGVGDAEVEALLAAVPVDTGAETPAAEAVVPQAEAVAPEVVAPELEAPALEAVAPEADVAVPAAEAVAAAPAEALAVEAQAAPGLEALAEEEVAAAEAEIAAVEAALEPRAPDVAPEIEAAVETAVAAEPGAPAPAPAAVEPSEVARAAVAADLAAAFGDAAPTEPPAAAPAAEGEAAPAAGAPPEAPAPAAGDAAAAATESLGRTQPIPLLEALPPPAAPPAPPAGEPAAADIAAAFTSAPAPSTELPSPAPPGAVGERPRRPARSRPASGGPRVITIDLPEPAVPEAESARRGPAVFVDAYVPSVVAPPGPIVPPGELAAPAKQGRRARRLRDPRVYATMGTFLGVWAVVFVLVALILGEGGSGLIWGAVVALVGFMMVMLSFALPRRAT